MAEAELVARLPSGRPSKGVHVARVLAIGFRLHLKMMTRSSFDGFP